MSENFKADLYQVGNIERSLSESADGDLVFRSHLVPAGIKLSTLLGQDLTELTQVLAEIDAIYQSVLNFELEDIYDVVGGIANFTVPISASTFYGDGSNLTGIGTTFLALQDTPSTYTGRDGYLVIVQGNDLNFVDPITIQTSTTLLQTVSASLQSEIDLKISSSDVMTISGDLRALITNNENDIIYLQTYANDISGNLQTQINNLDLIYATDTILQAISADILDRIEVAAGSFLGLSDTPDSYTGANTFLVAVSGDKLYFKDPATIKTDITDIESKIATISGDLQILETYTNGITGGLTQLDDRYINNVYGDFITTSEVEGISSTLNGLIINLRSDVDSISGDLQILETYTNGITGGLTQLDDRFVNSSGDTVAGALVVQGALTLSSYSSLGPDTQVKMDQNGTIKQHNYSPIIGGKITLNINEYLYNVTDPNIKSTSNPVCTIVAPLSASTIYGASVFGITNGSFNVELTDTPAISGYYLNWLSFELI
jgi:hypothetical protein